MMHDSSTLESFSYFSIKLYEFVFALSCFMLLNVFIVIFSQAYQHFSFAAEDIQCAVAFNHQ